MDFSNTLETAKNLLGMYLIHETPKGIIKGKIIETEAYLQNDPASHSYNGLTNRNSAMFEEPGTIYVYFTYGMYHCMNIVTNKKGIGEAVLIRAIEPIEGIELMKKNRGKEKNLCDGPAKLTIAFGINKEHNNAKLNSKLRLETGEKPKKIYSSKRIGISKGKDLKYRFYIK